MTGPTHVAVVGLMGVGKTTVAAGVADALGWSFRDSDADIEERTGATGREFAESHGVAELHQLEGDVLIDALASDDPSVVAAAASVVERADCRGALRAHAFTVVLSLDLDQLQERIASGHHRRSMSRVELDAIAARRGPLFAEVADLELDAGSPPDDLVQAVLFALEGTSLR